MTTLPQLEKVLNDYGPTVGIIIIMFLLIIMLKLMWKPMAAIVDMVRLIVGDEKRKIPSIGERFDTLETASAEKKAEITGLKTELAAHIVEAKQAGAAWQAEWAPKVQLLLDRQQEVVREIKHNGGSSMKDASALTGETARRIEEKLDRLLGTT